MVHEKRQHKRVESFSNPVFGVDDLDDPEFVSPDSLELVRTLSADCAALPLELRGHSRNISVQSVHVDWEKELADDKSVRSGRRSCRSSICPSPPLSPSLTPTTSRALGTLSLASIDSLDPSTDPALTGYRKSPWYLNLSTPFATVIGTTKPGSRAEQAQQILSCRFIMAIFLLDAMGWGISKMA
eukprot:44497-Prorocentrum_minimum.AAC.1